MVSTSYHLYVDEDGDDNGFKYKILSYHVFAKKSEGVFFCLSLILSDEGKFDFAILE